jgi:hypothetical protein
LPWVAAHLVGVLLACSAAAAPATTVAHNHAEALGALANVRAAIDDIQGAHGDLLSGAAGSGEDCAHAAHRAINDLVGAGNADYRQSDGFGGMRLERSLISSDSPPRTVRHRGRSRSHTRVTTRAQPSRISCAPPRKPVTSHRVAS